MHVFESSAWLGQWRRSRLTEAELVTARCAQPGQMAVKGRGDRRQAGLWPAVGEGLSCGADLLGGAHVCPLAPPPALGPVELSSKQCPWDWDPGPLPRFRGTLTVLWGLASVGGAHPSAGGPPRPRGGILVLGHCSSGTVPRPCSPRVSQPPWGPRTDEPGVGHPRPLSRVSQASVSRRVQMPNEHKPPHLPNQHSAPYQQKGHRREEFDSWPCVPVRGWVSPGPCFAVGSSTPRVFREW